MKVRVNDKADQIWKSEWMDY